jgi:hypothetical protein
LNYPKFSKKRKQNYEGGSVGNKDQEQEQEQELPNAEPQDTQNDDPDNPVQSDDQDSYDYLLSMRIDSLTEEKLQKLEHDRDVLLDKLTTLQNKTAEGLWSDDLDALKEVYMQSLDDWHESYEIAKPEIQSKLVKKAVSFKKNPLPPPKKVTIMKKV